MIEATWTDEQLFVTFAAMQDRLARDAEREVQLAALALGRPLSAPTRDTPPPASGKPTARIGQVVETYD